MKKSSLCKLVLAVLVAGSFLCFSAHAQESPAMGKLIAAGQKAHDADGGDLPGDSGKKSSHEEWVESQQNAGGGPGQPNTPPNPEDVPFAPGGIRNYYQSLFGQWWNASAFGHGRGFGDRDATPE